MTRTIRSLFTVFFASSLVFVATPIANATPQTALPAAQVHIARAGSIGVGSSAVVQSGSDARTASWSRKPWLR